MHESTFANEITEPIGDVKRFRKGISTEKYGGEYIARTENVTSLSTLRKPDRVIIIKFPSREKLAACFASDEYRRIMHDRVDNVDARAVIVEE